MIIQRVLIASAIALIRGCTTGPDATSPGDPAPADTNSHTGIRADSLDLVTANTISQAILLNNAPEQLDERTVQGMLDSLSSSTPATRKLHAKAISRIWNRCDGAVAEAVGLAALEYVTERPVEYFSLFPTELADQEMPIWANMIAQELLIDAENDPAGAADAFAADIRARCRNEGSSKDVEVERLRRQVQAVIADLTSQQ